MGPLVAKYLHTVVKKTREGRPIDSLNVESYPTAFYLTCLPVQALRQMWILQVRLSLSVVCVRGALLGVRPLQMYLHILTSEIH